MKDADLAWLAGLLEGEGCFYLAIRHNKDGTPRPLVSVLVTMTDEDVVCRVHEVVKTGAVYRREPKRVGWKTSWTWCDSNVDNVVPLIRLLKPLMGARRSAKIDEMLAAVDGWERRPMVQHGTRSMYVKGCHCAVCRTAHAAYMRRYKRATLDKSLLEVGRHV